MRESPRVSVVVPFFNRQRFLGACVEALLSQDGVGGPVEIVLVDNGSTDGPRPRLHDIPRSLSCARRLRGLRGTQHRHPTAPGRRFSPLPTPTASSIATGCEPCATRCAISRSGFVVGNCRYPAGASPALRLLGAYENAKADYVVNRCAPACHFAYANNMAVRARVFEELGPFREWPRAADSELVHRLASRAARSAAGVSPFHARDAPRVPARARSRAAAVALHGDELADRHLSGAPASTERLGVLRHIVRRRRSGE